MRSCSPSGGRSSERGPRVRVHARGCRGCGDVSAVPRRRICASTRSLICRRCRRRIGRRRRQSERWSRRRAAARVCSARSSATTAATRSGSSIRSTGRRTTCAACRCGRRCSRSSVTVWWWSRWSSAPALGRRWWAVRGEGAFADGSRCRVSAVSRVEDATVSTTSARQMPAGWSEIVMRAWANRGFGDFWQHCLVAEGAVDVACDRVLQVWDYAPVQLHRGRSRRPLHDVRGRATPCGRQLRRDERGASRGRGLTSRRLTRVRLASDANR